MVVQKLPGGGTVITGEKDIQAYALLALKGALKLEVKGLQMSRGKSAYRIIKSRYGFRGSKQKVLEQFEAMLRERGILVESPCTR